MSRKTLIYFALTLVLSAYCIMSLTLSNQAAQAALCVNPVITLEDTTTCGFVTETQVRDMLSRGGIKIDSVTWHNINTLDIENMLGEQTNIESAHCYRTSDDRLHIDVRPMVPVMRVFDNKSVGYYVNRSGKRLEAGARYHIDVPVVIGHFDAAHPVTDILPLTDYIASDSTLNTLISAIVIDRKTRDIMLVPIIRGQVINFGDTTMIANKFARLKTMYHDVLPVKGWEFYDTLSVKFAGQVVATRRVKRLPTPSIRFDQPGDSIDEPDINIMTTDVVDPT